MKGPGYKTSLDVRRTWKCPACGVERKLLGDVTTMTCGCRDGGVFMAIVTERIVAPRPFQPLNESDVRSAEFGIEDMPVLLPHPSTIPAPRTPVRRSYGEPAKADAPQPPMTAPAPADNLKTVAVPHSTSARPKESKEANEPPVATRPTPPAPTPATTQPAATLASQPIVAPSTEPDDDWGAGIL